MPAAATALAVLAASAAPHGTTTLTLDGALADGLRAEGVAVARQTVLPVTGGRLGTGVSAALDLRGRLTLRAGSGRRARRVTLTAWRAEVRTGTTKLSAVVNGRRRAVLSATGVTRRQLDVNDGSGRVALSRVTLRLTRSGARTLKAGLGLTRLPAGALGTLKVAATLAKTGGGGTGGGNGGGAGGGTGGGAGGGTTRPLPPGCTPGFSSGTIAPAPAPLARPAGAVDVSSATLAWQPRESFLQYVASGEGASASEGAVAGPLQTRPGNGARLVYSFGFPLKAGSWFDAASGSGDLFGSGAVRFRYRAHGIDITVRNPEIELNGGRSRAIFSFVGGDCTDIAPVRGIMLDLAPAAPTVVGPSRDYGAIPARITEDGADMFSGFYLPGDPWGSFAAAFAAP